RGEKEEAPPADRKTPAKKPDSPRGYGGGRADRAGDLRRKRIQLRAHGVHRRSYSKGRCKLFGLAPHTALLLEDMNQLSALLDKGGDGQGDDCRNNYEQQQIRRQYR